MLKYHSPFLPEYRGNPLIEALPEIAPDKIVVKKLSHFPDYDESEREWPLHYRKHVIARLSRMRAPIPEYLSVFRMVERALFESYISKNPFSPTTANWLHRLNNSGTDYIPRTGLFQSTAQGMTVLGISGLGKTSMILQIMSYFGEALHHEEYDGKSLKLIQVPMLYVKCPHDGTLSGFCESIIRQLQARLGDEERFESTIGKMMNQIQSLVRRSFLGLLIVDDLQNLKLDKTGGKENFLNFLLNLIDEAGVPILFIANPEVTEVLMAKFRISRRAENLGCIEMHSLTKDVWDACFIEALWRYQWTSVKTECTSELNNYLYDISRGIIDIAVRIYMKCQELVIGTGDERITSAVLEQAFIKTCRLTKDGLILLDSESDVSTKSIENLRSYDSTPIRDEADNKLSSCKVNKLEGIVSDLNRIHHPEFESRLKALVASQSLSDKIGDFETIRKCHMANDRFKALADSNYLANDPLNLIADG